MKAGACSSNNAKQAPGGGHQALQREEARGGWQCFSQHASMDGASLAGGEATMDSCGRCKTDQHQLAALTALTSKGVMFASIKCTHSCTAAHPEYQPIWCGVLLLLWRLLVAGLAPSLPLGRCPRSWSRHRLAGSGSLSLAAGRRWLPLLVFPLQHELSFTLTHASGLEVCMVPSLHWK